MYLQAMDIQSLAKFGNGAYYLFTLFIVFIKYSTVKKVEEVNRAYSL